MSESEKKFKTGMYDITQIAPHQKNLRHKPVAKDLDAMRELLSNEKKHKVYELARDIVELGELDPTSRLIITPDPSNDGHFIALEGNRRITALKVLHNPQIAEGLPVFRDFKSLSKQFSKAPIMQVECVELSPEEAKPWIRRKHYKGMGGRGPIDWDAIQRARSDAMEDGRYTEWLSAINLLDKEKYDTGNILSGIDEKSTTVDRVFGSKYMREILGVSFSRDGTVTFDNGDTQAGCRLLYLMFEEMIKPDFVVSVVDTAAQQKKFIESFTEYAVKEAPSRTKGRGSDDTGKTGGGDDPSKKEKKASTPTKKVRKKLAAKGLNIGHEHLNNLYVELTKLPVSTYEHCAAAMLRVFLEKATMVFLLEKNIPHPDKSKKRTWRDTDVLLRTKVKAVLGVLDPAGKDKDLQYARDIANGNQDKVHSLNILNDYIHSAGVVIVPSELLKTWDRLHPYFNEMFAVLSEDGD